MERGRGREGGGAVDCFSRKCTAPPLTPSIGAEKISRKREREWGGSNERSSRLLIRKMNIWENLSGTKLAFPTLKIASIGRRQIEFSFS